jgi:hypothetical protein
MHDASPRARSNRDGGKISFDVTTTHELMDEEGAPEVTDLILFVDGQSIHRVGAGEVLNPRHPT